jgi:hypothetical protein
MKSIDVRRSKWIWSAKVDGVVFTATSEEVLFDSVVGYLRDTYGQVEATMDRKIMVRTCGAHGV